MSAYLTTLSMFKHLLLSRVCSNYTRISRDKAADLYRNPSTFSIRSIERHNFQCKAPKKSLPLGLVVILKVWDAEGMGDGGGCETQSILSPSFVWANRVAELVQEPRGSRASLFVLLMNNLIVQNTVRKQTVGGRICLRWMCSKLPLPSLRLQPTLLSYPSSTRV